MSPGLKGLSPERKAIALAGFIILGLSPSYMDWKQSPDPKSHRQFIAFYGVAITLFYFGLLQ